jgi:hypothetical protein
MWCLFFCFTISVVGGYLAYIGWFCGISGITLMAGTSDLTGSNILDPYGIYILPGLCAGIMIYIAIRTIRHMAVLPSCILFLFLFFYLILYCTNTTVQDATQAGWIRSLQNNKNENDTTTTTNGNNASAVVLSSFSWLHTWDYLQWDQVDWSVVPYILLTELSMIIVVALSSSLDVAAIELELEEQARQYNNHMNHTSHVPVAKQNKNSSHPNNSDHHHSHKDSKESSSSIGTVSTMATATDMSSSPILNNNECNEPHHHRSSKNYTSVQQPKTVSLPATLPLDYNHELQTVGYSNIISGLTGGYTGSYIFSVSRLCRSIQV